MVRVVLSWTRRMSLVLAIVLLGSLWSRADDAPQRGPLDPQQQAEVEQLVQQHLPELQTVLKYLRDHSPRQYERAMRDLWRQTRRLDTAQRRGAHFYDNELQTIKLETQIDLTVAKLRLNESPTLRQRLRTDLRRLKQLRVERLVFERELLKQRIERSQEQLAGVEERLQKAQHALESDAQQAYESLLRKAGQKPRSRASEKREAADPSNPRSP